MASQAQAVSHPTMVPHSCSTAGHQNQPWTLDTWKYVIGNAGKPMIEIRLSPPASLWPKDPTAFKCEYRAETGAHSCQEFYPSLNDGTPQTQCRAGFVNRKLLEEHKKVFHSHAPFLCSNTDCKHSFSDKHNLKRHDGGCLGVTAQKIKCAVCGVNSDRADNLKARHLKKKHPEVIANLSRSELAKQIRRLTIRQQQTNDTAAIRSFYGPVSGQPCQEHINDMQAYGNPQSAAQGPTVQPLTSGPVQKAPAVQPQTAQSEATQHTLTVYMDAENYAALQAPGGLPGYSKRPDQAPMIQPQVTTQLETQHVTPFDVQSFMDGVYEGPNGPVDFSRRTPNPFNPLPEDISFDWNSLDQDLQGSSINNGVNTLTDPSLPAGSQLPHVSAGVSIQSPLFDFNALPDLSESVLGVGSQFNPFMGWGGYGLNYTVLLNIASAWDKKGLAL